MTIVPKGLKYIDCNFAVLTCLPWYTDSSSRAMPALAAMVDQGSCLRLPHWLAWLAGRSPGARGHVVHGVAVARARALPAGWPAGGRIA